MQQQSLTWSETIQFLSNFSGLNIKVPPQTAQSSLWWLGGGLRPVDGLWKCWHLPCKLIVIFIQWRRPPLLKRFLSNLLKLFKLSHRQPFIQVGWCELVGHRLEGPRMKIPPAKKVPIWSSCHCVCVFLNQRIYEILWAGACKRKEKEEWWSFQWKKGKSSHFNHTNDFHSTYYSLIKLYQVNKVRKKHANASPGDVEVSSV